MQGIICIVVITNIMAKHICDTSIYSHQLHTIAISSNLRKFFNRNDNNLISFWDFPSNNKWPPHLLVNKESKYYKMNPILLGKLL